MLLQTATDYRRLSQITADYCKPPKTIAADGAPSLTTAPYRRLSQNTTAYYRLAQITADFSRPPQLSQLTANYYILPQTTTDYSIPPKTTRNYNRLLRTTTACTIAYCKILQTPANQQGLPKPTAYNSEIGHISADYHRLPQTNIF